MEGTAGAAVKVWSIEKNASILHELGHHLAILFDSGSAVFALVNELPLIGGKALGRFLGALAILLVGEVCTVAATALNHLWRGSCVNALATSPENTGPVTLEERYVEHPRPLALRIVEADPLVGIRRYRSHEENLVLGQGSFLHP